MKTETKIACIRSFGYWVRECGEGSPVKYIVVDPHGDEEGWMIAGGEEVLDETIEDLEVGNPQIIAAFREGVVTERIRACGHADCGVSSGIAEELTFGRGHIDDNGYWEIPCRPCAKAFERDRKDMATAYGVWPSAEDHKRMTK